MFLEPLRVSYVVVSCKLISSATLPTATACSIQEKSPKIVKPDNAEIVGRKINEETYA